MNKTTSSLDEGGMAGIRDYRRLSPDSAALHSGYAVHEFDKHY